MRATSTAYDAVHQRMRRIRGRAQEQPCADCGKQAAAWAYDKSDPNPLTWTSERGTVVYSADIERYRPLCTKCHHALDHPPKTHCKHGHALTGANVYQRPNGGRLCRTCKRDSLRRWRSENPDWREGVAS